MCYIPGILALSVEGKERIGKQCPVPQAAPFFEHCATVQSYNGPLQARPLLVSWVVFLPRFQQLSLRHTPVVHLMKIWPERDTTGGSSMRSLERSDSVMQRTVHLPVSACWSRHLHSPTEYCTVHTCTQTARSTQHVDTTCRATCNSPGATIQNPSSQFRRVFPCRRLALARRLHPRRCRGTAGDSGVLPLSSTHSSYQRRSSRSTWTALHCLLSRNSGEPARSLC
ncbi:hypothetical protein CC80DRAFT_71023 [Byssothecium circinans]|uniref:Uncharacterized protein n=1 Tax=Byssothecium circinans TaxID=147558 RepID=A0A6A5TUU4_9PLEO|nr:hypothetical protein CC80DRAFT_71023 [Byssothecium circinans]